MDVFQRNNLEWKVDDIRAIATTFYIDARDNGYLSHMSDKEMKREPF